MRDQKQDNYSVCVDDDAMLRKAEEHIQKLTYELKEREAEKAYYIKENNFLKESLRRIVGV